MRLFSTLLALSIPALPAQTFVVDAAGGPGSHFTDIGTATNSVPDGAILLVRPGNYLSFTIDQKSLTVLADPGVVVNNLFAMIEVRNLQTGQQVALRGLSSFGGLAPGGIRCLDNSGMVLIDHCTPFGQGTHHCYAMNSADVRIVASTFAAGSSPLYVQDSRVQASDSSFGTSFPYAGIQMLDGSLTLADVTVRGGGGYPAGSAIHMTNGALRLLGGGSLTIAQSPYANSGTVIAGTGTARADPTFVLNPVSGPAVGPNVTFTTRSMPVVAAATGSTGGTARGNLDGPAGAVGLLFLGFPAPPAQVLPFVDDILLAAGTESLRAIGPLGVPLTASYAVPLQPALRGVRVAWQGASFDAANGAQVSNAVTYVHW